MTFSTSPDNLNTHHPASLYEAFEPAEARRIAERLEIHYTPKHGSWLNMAEPELAVLTRQCLDRRIPDQELWAKRPEPGKTNGTDWMSGQNGVSPPRTPASSSSPFTHHFNSDRVLVSVEKLVVSLGCVAFRRHCSVARCQCLQRSPW